MNHIKYALVGLILLLILFPTHIGFCAEKGRANFTAHEREWIKTHPVIRLGVSGTPSPISFWDGPSLSPNPSSAAISPSFQQTAKSKASPDSPEKDLQVQQTIAGADQNNAPISYYHGPVNVFTSSGFDNTQSDLVQVTTGQQDQFKGVTADYLQQISALTGIHFEVVLATFDNHRGLHDALNRGEIDMVPTVLLNPAHRPLPNAYRTRSYIKVPVVIVTRREMGYIDNLKSLEDMRVAGVLSTQLKLQRLGLPVNLIHVGPDDGLRGVSTGKYDAFICELTGVSQALADMPLTNIKISGELPAPSLFAMEVSPQLQELVPILNKALDAMPRENRTAIWKNWFRIEYETKMIDAPWVQTLLIGALLLAMIAFTTVFFVQRRFKRIKMAVEALDPHLLSVRMDKNVIITEVTEAFCRATGFDCHDLVGQPLMALGSPVEESLNAHGYIWETLKRGKHWRGEVKLLKKDGATMWVEAVVSPLRRKNDEASGYTAIYQDVSERKYFENLAVRDELTGLYNRRHFNQITQTMLRKVEEQGQIFALILIDVDNFKKYNDNYGHPAGDKVLAAIGRELRDHFQRHDDMVFRMGGEEFGAVVISPAKEAALCAQKILTRIRNLNIAHEHNPPGVVTVSVGVCTTEKFPGHDLGKIYQAADEALYTAKSTGRNQVVLNDSRG